jgi:hypothetical protein
VTASKRPIRLVFDTSAILAYSEGSIHAGEPLAVVEEEGGVVGLPVLCLVEANWAAVDPDRLRVLVNHKSTTILPTSDDVGALAVIEDSVGRLDSMSAMKSAMDEGACLLSSRFGVYAGLENGGPVIPIPRR